MLARLLVTAAMFSATPALAATLYADRSSLEAALDSSFTDTYEASLGYPAGPGTVTISDAAMNAVVGETRYTSTGFADNNILLDFFNRAYCAGCNGSFTLDFSATSFTVGNGVFGVGVDVAVNNDDFYDALVTFGDGSTMLYALPTFTFFGLTDPRGIASIAFGPGGGTSQTGFFVIDNLIIGDGADAVPAPAALGLMLAGVVGILRHRRREIAAA